MNKNTVDFSNIAIGMLFRHGDSTYIKLWAINSWDNNAGCMNDGTQCKFEDETQVIPLKAKLTVSDDYDYYSWANSLTVLYDGLEEGENEIH